MTAGRLALLLGRQYLRSPLLIALFIVVPLVFLNLAYVTTKKVDIPVLVTEGGNRVTLAINQPDLHGAIMVPMVAAFLTGIAGLFITLEARRCDERLRIAGVSAPTVAAMRLLMIAAIAVAVALVSVAITLIHFHPNGLVGFTVGTLLVSVSYAFVGGIVSVLVGRLGGAYVMLLLPMIDLGIFQDPMLISGDQAAWMKLLPGFGGMRFAVDAAFSVRADDWSALFVGIAWTAALCAGALVVFQRGSR